jgi:hypothetical protein
LSIRRSLSLYLSLVLFSLSLFLSSSGDLSEMTSFLLAFAGCHFLLILFVLSSSVHIQSSLGNFEPSFGFLSYEHGDSKKSN